MKKIALMAVLSAAVGFAGEKTVLWRGGDDGIAVYRIPALCTAPNGDLVAVCDARRDNGGDLNAFQPINIVCRRSSDGGKTWTPSAPTWTWPWTDSDKWSGSDPSLIVDAQAKKIFLLYNVWHWKNSDGSDRFGNVYRFHVQESSDNGKTWSKPRDITDDISFPEWPFGRAHNAGGFIFISSGSGIQTKDGTLLHTLVHVNDGNALFGSPDHGKTWKAYGKPVEMGDECKVVELRDGSWMINSRWRGGGRQIHVSKDRGLTWASRYDMTLEDPQCNAQIMRYGDKLLFTNCKSPTRRALLHLRVSADDGATWSDGLCVEPQGAAYSDMTILPNGDVGVIYEGAGYNTIIFTTVPAPRAAAARKVRIACIGDSITYGLGLADRENESYPAQLQKAFDERFPGKCEVRNFGNSGRGIYLDSMRGRERRGFRHMPEHRAALAWKPDVVVCNLGINDCGEYIKEYTGGRRRGQFRDDYLALLGDYRKAVPRAKLFIWTKLSPLAEGQRFHRSPEPFLMQRDLEDVARRAGAVGIDMQEPLREEMDEIFARDKIHPDAEGARIIAARTSAAILPAGTPCGLMPDVDSPVKLPSEVAKVPHEVWLCAGQSNMQKGWGEFNATPEEQARVASEMARLAKCNIHFWDFNDGRWSKLTPENALRKSAFGVSFAIRRAEKTGKAIGMLYVAAGGAPTEAFLSEATMCAVGADGKPLYPHLAAIATNRRRLDRNEDFPCAWVAREYPRRRGNSEEARWWPVSEMYDHGIKRIKEGGIKVDGILWYQGESNATACTTPDGPTPSDYQLETLRALVAELRATSHEPRATFLMMGLPKMNRPWEPYRAAQRQVCAETGAIYVDAFGAGLGDERDVHPRDKVPFAELAIGALENSKRTTARGRMGK